MKPRTAFWVWLFCVFSAGTLSCDHQRPKVRQKAIHGFIDLRAWDLERQGIVKLDGEWEFYWNKLLTPDDFSPDSVGKNFFTMPGTWRGHKLKGQILPGHGFATFRLKVKLNKQRLRYGLKILSMGTAYRLWANHELIATNGRVGKSAEEMRPQYLPQAIFGKTERGTIELVLQISNFNERNGGMWASLELGTAKQILRKRIFSVASDLFVFGALFIMGLYHFVLFFLRRDDRSSLFFGGFAFDIAFRSLLCSERLLIYAFPNFPWELLEKLEFLTIALTPLFPLFLTSIFKKESPRFLLRVVVGCSIAWGALIIVTPAKIYTETLPIFHIVIALGLYLNAHILVLALVRKRQGSLVAFLGGLSIVLVSINDIMVADQIYDFVYLLGFGMTAMVFSQSILLAILFSNAFTKVKTLSTDLEKKNIDLQKMDQLKDEFLANTSHELRTPLNGIIGMSEALIQGSRGPLSRELRRDLSLISVSGRRLTGLVNDILDFSKLKHQDLVLSPKPLALDSIVSLVLMLCEPTKGNKDIRLQNEVPEDLPAVLADENRMQQILQNLIGNAIKFTESGAIKVAAQVSGEEVRVSVRDSGIGIAKEKQAKIFEQFEQADGSTARKYGGTGLGLSISKKLVELHGGKIWCESTLGQGTTFFFTLPMSQEKSEVEDSFADSVINSSFLTTKQDSTETDAALSHVGTGPKVLAVDDENLNLEVVSSHLKLHDFQVLVASSGQQALEILEREDKPDLILLDVMMPHMTGLEVCKNIRQRYSESELPIILLTAKNQLSDLMAGFSSGANDYLVKPFSSKELLARIQNHIKVKNLTEEIIQRRETQIRIEKDLDAARAVQETLFIPSPPVPEIETLVYYKSADKTGGDWYGAFYDETHKRIIYMLGDVTGHGFPSSLVTGVACGAARSHFYALEVDANKTTAEMLVETATLLNRVVHETGYLSKKTITMAFLAIDLHTGEATYLNAGHNQIYHLHGKQLSPLLITSTPLGYSESTVFETKQIRVQPEDMFFLFTDGLIENTGPDNESTLKQRKLEQLLKNAPANPKVLSELLLEKCQQIWQSHPPDDDCTFMIIKHLGSSKKVQLS